MRFLSFLLLALHAPAFADWRSTERALDDFARRQAIEHAPDSIRRVNRQVNALGLTDCKAQAFEKLRRLTRYGINADRAMMVVVRTETGAYHAIAMIDRKWAMDGRFNEVMTIEALKKLGYAIAPVGDS